MRRFILAGLAISALIAPPAQAQACDCARVVPVEGDYIVGFNEKIGRRGTPVPVTLSLLDQASGAGTGFQMEGPGARVELSCAQDGYEGAMFAGGQLPQLTIAPWEDVTADVAAPDIPAEALEPGTSVPIGVRLATEFSMYVFRNAPDMVLQAGDEPVAGMDVSVRDFLSVRAPADMCETVARKIASNRDYIAGYSDQELIDEAVRLEQAAVSSDYLASMDGTSEDSDVYYVPENYPTSYRNDMLRKHIDAEIPEGQEVTDGPTANTVAGMNTESCRITPPGPREPDGSCRLGVVIDAAMAHEMQHRSDCEFFLGDDDASYTHYINHPINLAEGEVTAHRAGLAVLEQWHGRYCQ